MGLYGDETITLHMHSISQLIDLESSFSLSHKLGIQLILMLGILISVWFDADISYS